MRKFIMLATAAMIASGVVTAFGHTAHAQFRGTAYSGSVTTAQAGSWKAFAAKTPDGDTVCGVDETGSNGKYLSVKHYNDDNRLTVQATKDNWDFDPGSSGQIYMQFDNLRPWTATARADGDTIEFSVDLDSMDQFEDEFRHAYTLTIQFGSDYSWIADLTGTNRITNALANCVSGQMAYEEAVE